MLERRVVEGRQLAGSRRLFQRGCRRTGVVSSKIGSLTFFESTWAISTTRCLPPGDQAFEKRWIWIVAREFSARLIRTRSAACRISADMASLASAELPSLIASNTA